VLPFLLTQAIAGRRLSSSAAALVAALYAQERLTTAGAASTSMTADTLATRS
jgi:hypothetical protein